MLFCNCFPIAFFFYILIAQNVHINMLLLNVCDMHWRRWDVRDDDDDDDDDDDLRLALAPPSVCIHMCMPTLWLDRPPVAQSN
jgi:hypothetical protein